jgi:hypothetical protein
MSRRKTSITVPIRDANLIQAALTDAGLAKLKALGDRATMSGAGSVELQLALQLQERITAATDGPAMKEIASQDSQGPELLGARR